MSFLWPNARVNISYFVVKPSDWSIVFSAFFDEFIIFIWSASMCFSYNSVDTALSDDLFDGNACISMVFLGSLFIQWALSYKNSFTLSVIPRFPDKWRARIYLARRRTFPKNVIYLSVKPVLERSIWIRFLFLVINKQRFSRLALASSLINSTDW